MSWLAAVLALPPTRRPTLVDGNDEVAGDAWDGRIHGVREAIESTGLQPGEAVAFPCRQTVGDVVLLLALLERGLSVTLQSENDSAPHAPFWRGTVRWHEGLEFRSTDTPTLRRDAAPRLFVHTSGSLDRAKLVVHDPVFGDGGVRRVHVIAEDMTREVQIDDPRVQADVRLGSMPPWMLVPVGGNPYADDLVGDYWFAVRSLVATALTR